MEYEVTSSPKINIEIDLIKDLEEYKQLIRKYRNEIRINFYNNYLSLESINRYINLHRLGYCGIEGGFVISVDEEEFLHIFTCLPQGVCIDFKKYNKPVFIRNIYRNIEDTEKNSFDTELINSGFKLKGSSVEVVGDVKTVYDNSSGAKRYIDRIVKNGFKIDFLREDRIDEVYQLLYETEFIKYYHENYLTQEEKKRLAERGGYIGVIDPKGHLCAVAITHINGYKANGTGIVVKDEYRILGLALIVNYMRMKWLLDNNINKIYGWIDKDNKDSILFHEKLNYEFSGRITREWLLEKEEKNE